MSFIQRLIARFVSADVFASMKHDSERWVVRCECGAERSIWELGGIRWKATGNSRTYMKCATCGRSSWQQLHFRDHPGSKL